MEIFINSRIKDTYMKKLMLLIFLLFIISCTNPNQVSQRKNFNPETINKSEEINPMLSICFEYTNSMEYGILDEIWDSQQDRCIFDYAKTYVDIEACELIEGKSYYDNCILSTSEERREIYYCERFLDKFDKKECIIDFAVSRKRDVCFFIEAEQDIKDCRERLKLSMPVSDCENEQIEQTGPVGDISYPRDSCYIEMARIHDNPEICNITKFPNDCLQYMKYNSQIEKEDYSECFGAFKQDCLLFKAWSTLDISLCPETRYKYSCLRNIAIKLNDISICENIDDISQFKESFEQELIESCKNDVQTGNEFHVWI